MGGIGEKEQARHHLLVDEEGPLLKVGERVKQEMFTQFQQQGCTDCKRGNSTSVSLISDDRSCNSAECAVIP